MLIIKKGGVLVNEDGEDITNDTPRNLFEECELDEDVTLRDIFLLMNKHLDFYDFIFKNWTKEIVTEGLTKKKTDLIGIKYLELKRHNEFIKQDEELSSDILFLGKSSDKEQYENSIGVDFISSQDLIDLPLKLDKEYSVHEYKKTLKKENVLVFGKKEFKLVDILYSIIREMSFYGSPEDRNKAYEDLLKRIKSENI